MDLTPDQIKHFETLQLRKKVGRHSLNIAIQHYENKMEETLKDETKWWKEISKIYDIDIETKNWKVSHVLGNATIVEVKEKT